MARHAECGGVQGMHRVGGGMRPVQDVVVAILKPFRCHGRVRRAVRVRRRSSLRGIDALPEAYPHDAPSVC